MKLATFRDGTRDGALAVVSRDLTKAVKAEAAVAGLRTLQQLLDDWQSTQLKVERIYAELNEAVDGRRPAPFDMVDFDERPLHRTIAAGLSVGRRIGLRQPRRAGAARARRRHAGELLDRAADVPGRVGCLPGAARAHRAGDEAWGIDLEGEIAVITDDVPMGVTPEDAGGHICLLMLVNDVSLRNLIPAELAKGFGFLPRQAVDGVLGRSGDAGRVGAGVARGQAAPAAPRLRQRHAAGQAQCRRRHDLLVPAIDRPCRQDAALAAGSIIGSGTVSNKEATGRAAGWTRAAPATPALPRCARCGTNPRGQAEGRRSSGSATAVRIEMLDESGRSIFGAIEQEGDEVHK
jgi:fumarylacetoacetate (FAA) hydrolase